VRVKILSESFAPRANLAQVARRHDVSNSQVYTWQRKLLARPDEHRLVPDSVSAEAVLVSDAAATPSSAALAIIIDLARGQRVMVFAAAPPALVSAAL
jgi:transposase